MDKIRIGVLTSGGDAPGMNACIRAIVRTAIFYDYEVYGIENGYQGLLKEQIFKFERKSVSNILSKGGTILGSARLESFKNQEEVRIKAKEILNKYKMNYLIAIGGDGTYEGALKLSKLGVKVIGIPATIDNDINTTDYSIGFSTALNTIVEAIDKLRDTAESHQRCSIVETMGRNCPDLALYAGICSGSEFVITNQDDLDIDNISNQLKMQKQLGRRHAIIIITEKITNVYELAKLIEEKSGYETRATILGYVQRGGSPTPEDRILASKMGSFAIDILSKNIYNCVIGISNNKLIHTNIEDIGKKIKQNNLLKNLIEKIK